MHFDDLLQDVHVVLYRVIDVIVVLKVDRVIECCCGRLPQLSANQRAVNKVCEVAFKVRDDAEKRFRGEVSECRHSEN